MLEMTMQVPDTLGQRLRPMLTWVPIILELSLAGFKTPAVRVVSEVIAFLSTGPAPEQVAMFTVSERAQQRMRRLLTLNQAGLLSEDERDELDELEQLEHLLIMLKAQTRKRLAGAPE